MTDVGNRTSQPVPSVDVLAAQVRKPLQRWADTYTASGTIGTSVDAFFTALAALDALVARVTEAERERKTAEEWARVMEHERDYEQEVVSRDLSERLADARNALKRIAYMAFDVNASAVSDLANAKSIASEVLARLDGNQP